MKREHPPVFVRVGTISGNSGVYVANRNVILGMSYATKQNIGFGSLGSNNLVTKTYSAVYDPDYIDTPVDDRDVKIYHHHHASPYPQITQVGFEQIHVSTMAQNSGVFVGDVKITGLDTHTKQNAAQGTTSGDRNVEMSNLNYVTDRDVIDTPINDQDIKWVSR